MIWFLAEANVCCNSVFRDCKIIRDPQSLKSKGYGFVSFVNKVVSRKLPRGYNVIIEPRHEKIWLQGLWPGTTQLASSATEIS